MSRVIIMLPWEESERGWGVRPDGYSIHASPMKRDIFVKAYWASMPDIAPDDYSRPSGVAALLDTGHAYTLPPDLEWIADELDKVDGFRLPSTGDFKNVLREWAEGFRVSQEHAAERGPVATLGDELHSAAEGAKMLEELAGLRDDAAHGRGEKPRFAEVKRATNCALCDTVVPDDQIAAHVAEHRRLAFAPPKIDYAQALAEGMADALGVPPPSEPKGIWLYCTDCQRNQHCNESGGFHTCGVCGSSLLSKPKPKITGQTKIVEMDPPDLPPGGPYEITEHRVVGHGVGEQAPMTPEQQASHDHKVRGPRVLWQGYVDGSNIWLRVVFTPEQVNLKERTNLEVSRGLDAMWRPRWEETSDTGYRGEALHGLARELDRRRTAIADDRLAIIKMLRDMADQAQAYMRADDDNRDAFRGAMENLRLAADLIEKGQIGWPPNAKTK